MIRLTSFTPAGAALSRPHLFPGRAMGEQAFDALQAYADARLAPLLAGRAPGILYGLEVDLEGTDAVPGPSLRIRSGLGVAGNGRALGLFNAVHETWLDLVRGYLRDTGADSAVGVHLLLLQRRYLPFEDGGIDPCRRAERDPLRDLRTVAVGSLTLRRLSISAAALAALTPAALANEIAASNVQGDFLARLGHAIPLGLLAVEALEGGATASLDDAATLAELGCRTAWFSHAAARWPALPDAGYRVLLAQTRDALFAARDAAIAAGDDVGDALEAGLKLRWLPAAGELPLDLLEQPAARAPARPRLRWLPAHVAVDMVPVPEALIPDLIERHLPREPLDLGTAGRERIRLLLAVDGRDYRPDLLDLPVTDAALADELHRHHRWAHEAWRDWRREFDRLYHLLDQGSLGAGAVRALALPTPEPAVERPGAFYDAFKAARRAELTGAGADRYPYDQPNPTPPQGYRDWLTAHNGTPPLPPAPAENGLVVQYRITQVDMEATDNKIRALRLRLEKTRDYVLLQRQQLDSQTVSLASLAGGVAGDGAGLQVARWLPFTELVGARAPAPPEPAPEEGAGGGGTASSAQPVYTASFVNPIGALNLTQSFQLSESAGFANVFAGVPASGGKPSAGASPGFSVAGIARPGVLGIPAMSRLQDARASTVELGLKFDRLNRLKAAPKRAITEPAFESQSYRFGAIDHIRPEVNAYAQAYRGMTGLLDTLRAMFDAAEAARLRGRLAALGSLTDPDALPDLAASGAGAEAGQLNGVQARYEALFAAGQLLTRQIALMEGIYNGIEAELTAELRTRIDQETRLEKLAGQIEESRQRLDGLDRRRTEHQGDYGVARALTIEDHARVRAAYLERIDVLTRRLRGLFYVRERAAPVTLPLADPLSLRHADPGDPVPGCDWDTEVDVDAELTSFFDTLLEVPMDAWAVLRPLRPHLPAPVRVDYLLGLRAERFRQRGRHAVAPLYGQRLAAHLAPVLGTNRSVLGAFGARKAPPAQGSLAGWNDAAAAVLSLADLVTGANGPLKQRAQQLHNQLEQCVVCLRRRLEQTAPSLRLRWAQLAEDDRLDVTEPGRWPGLADAEAEDFDNTRTIAELVDWCFRQLHDSAGAEARAALKDMLRATIIVAARADPQEMLRGQVAVPPRRLAVGETLRLQLSRPALVGAQLQLLDDARRVVGLVRIQDQDERGAVADIVQVSASTTVTTRFAVLATKATARLG